MNVDSLIPPRVAILNVNIHALTNAQTLTLIEALYINHKFNQHFGVYLFDLSHMTEIDFLFPIPHEHLL